MKYFLEPHKDLGKVIGGKSITLIYSSGPNRPNIKTVTSTCGCNVPKWNNKEVILKYNNEALPFGYNTETRVNKSVTVIYTDNTSEELSFELIKIRK